MRKTPIRRLEALEKEQRSREQKELSSLEGAQVYIWMIVFAYYLGDLSLDGSPHEANVRALKYPTRGAYFDALQEKAVPEVRNRFNNAYRRLFAKAGLDVDGTPRSVLFDAFVKMVNRLPEQWLSWLRSNLREYCRDAEIATGSNLPRRLSCDNFLLWR
jgi:hypothetical protein